MTTHVTPVDIIKLAMKTAAVEGVGQTPDPEDVNDCFILLNALLAEWQVNRWLVYDLVESIFTATGAASYTVGATGNFVFPSRPDKIDAAFIREISTQTDRVIYPFMSREGYDRAAMKATTGIPESYFYSASMNPMGTLFIYPPAINTYEIHVLAKSSLGPFPTLTTTITLPPIYITALRWNLANDILPIFGMPPNPQVALRAEATLKALVNSVTQGLPQSVSPTAITRAGVYSALGALAQSQEPAQ